MAYNKKTWISNEIISKNALNNIENGIEAVEQSIPKKISQLENDAGYITEHLDLSNYAEKDDLHEHNNKDVLDEISLVRMQAWDNAALNGGNGGESVDLSNYATKQDLNLKADRSELFSRDYNELDNKPEIPSIEGLASEEFVESAISNIEIPEAYDDTELREMIGAIEVPSVEGLATEDFVRNAIAEAELNAGDQEVDLSGFATKDDLNGLVNEQFVQEQIAEAAYDDAELRNMVAEKADKSELFSKDYNDLLNKPTIPDLNGYATQSYVNNEIQNKVSSLESQINALLERIVALENQSGNVPEDPEEPEVPTTIPCTSITLDKTSLTFENYNTQTIRATVIPSNTTDTISWKSSSNTIATVSNGVITPKSDGSCTITATCGNYSASCNVLVNIEESVNTYSITNNLTNVSTNNSATSIEEGQAYNAILTCGNDYNISSVVVTMNGIDITNDIYEPEYSEDPEGSTYSITNNLTNVSTNNPATSIEEGQPYNAILTCGNDYDMSSVVVTMNGINVTNSVYEPEDPTT